MIRTAMIIAPHPDDEINLAGQFLISCKDNNIQPYVLFTTNGDADEKIGNRRMTEAVAACSVLGVPRENVIFLGYANEWKEGHIYSAKKDEILVSKRSLTETSGLESIPEYCYKKLRNHHSFTRNSFHDDLKNAINDILPDILICVDYDTHPDHRACSLMFEEVLGELLHENKRYRPMVLKKFAYAGVWKGSKDYYSKKRTTNMLSDSISNQLEQTGNPYLKWSERIAFDVPKQTLTTLLRSNIIYKAAKKHKVTTAWYQMLRVINGDIVYWWRPTNNLLYDPETRITASSGEVGYLDDFKLFDTDDVFSHQVKIDCEKMWKPDENDMTPKIEIEFGKKKNIKIVRIYQCRNNGVIKRIRLSSNEFEKEMIINDETPYLNVDIETEKLSIDILEYEGRIGITELELYEIPLVFPYEKMPMERYMREDAGSCDYTLIQRLELLSLMGVFLFKYKIPKEYLRGVFDGR